MGGGGFQFPLSKVIVPMTYFYSDSCSYLRDTVRLRMRGWVSLVGLVNGGGVVEGWRHVWGSLVVGLRDGLVGRL